VQIPYDGATNLECLEFRKYKTSNSDAYAYHLLFTDGMDTLGTFGQPRIIQAPVFIIATNPTVNSILLNLIGM